MPQHEELEYMGYEILEMMKERQFHVLVRGQDDSLFVELELCDYPGMDLQIQPHELWVDGDLWSHDAQFGDIKVPEGDVKGLGDFVTVENYRIIDDSMGPKVMNLTLSTEGR